MTNYIVLMAAALALSAGACSAADTSAAPVKPKPAVAQPAPAPVAAAVPRYVKAPAGMDYTYDNNSNRLTTVPTWTGAVANFQEVATYDNLNRVTKVNRGTISANTIADGAAASWS